MSIGKTDAQVEALMLRLGGITTPGRFPASRLCAAVRDLPGPQTEARVEMITHCAGSSTDEHANVWVEGHGNM